MASWLDIVSLVLTVGTVVGLVWGVLYVLRQLSQWAESTKESLKSKGVNLSQHGMSVKTSKRLDRERYMDATQRGFIKALNNSTYGQNDKFASKEPSPSGSAPSSRHNSVSESEKKRFFGSSRKAQVAS